MIPKTILKDLIKNQLLTIEVRMNSLYLINPFYSISTLYNVYASDDIPEVTNKALEEMKKKVIAKILLHQNIIDHMKETCIDFLIKD